MRFALDVVEQPELVEQLGGARLQHLAAELAVERLVLLEHQHVDATLGEEPAQHQPGRAAADDARVYLHGHDALRILPQCD
jgi:hypothetical protein